LFESSDYKEHTGGVEGEKDEYMEHLRFIGIKHIAKVKKQIINKKRTFIVLFLFEIVDLLCVLFYNTY